VSGVKCLTRANLTRMQATVIKYTRRTVHLHPVVVFLPRCDGSYWPGSTDGQLMESDIHSCLRTPWAAPPTLRLMTSAVSLSALLPPAESTGCQR